MADYPSRFDQIHAYTERLRKETALKMQDDHDRPTRGMDEPSAVTVAAKEVDEERREISDVVERIRSRQNYFFEKAQMLRAAASHYDQMAQDLAELLNNPYVDGKNKSSTSYEH